MYWRTRASHRTSFLLRHTSIKVVSEKWKVFGLSWNISKDKKLHKRPTKQIVSGWARTRLSHYLLLASVVCWRTLYLRPYARNRLCCARYQYYPRNWCSALSHLLLLSFTYWRPFTLTPVYHHIFCSTSHSQLQVKGRVADDLFTAVAVQESHWGLTRNVFFKG